MCSFLHIYRIQEINKFIFPNLQICKPSELQVMVVIIIYLLFINLSVSWRKKIEIMPSILFFYFFPNQPSMVNILLILTPQ